MNPRRKKPGSGPKNPAAAPVEGAPVKVVGSVALPKKRQTATQKEAVEKLTGAARPKARNAAPRKAERTYATMGSHSYVDDEGKIVDDPGLYRKLKFARAAGSFNKTAGIFMDMGFSGANVDDSGNLQAYNFEFPNDALEMPQSRREEIRYFRIAYDRDPIVGRAIDLHTELPLSKLILEKPKCSVESFADFVFDWFQGWVNEVDLFGNLLHASREYWLIGDAFLFIEHHEDLEKFPLCPVAKRQLSRRERLRGGTPEAHNPTEGVDELALYQWVGKNKVTHLLKEAKALGLVDANGMLDVERKLGKVATELAAGQTKFAKLGSVKKTAEPGDTPEPMMDSPLQAINKMRGETAEPAKGDNIPGAGGPDDLGAEGDEGDLTGDPLGGDLGGDMGGDLGGDLGGGLGSIGGDTGGGGLLGTDDGSQAPPEDPHIQNLRRYLELLEKKKKLLEELRAIKEEKKREWELFSHVVNPDYFGPERMVILPPDVVEIRRDKRFNSEPTICYRPSEVQKAAYLEDPDVDARDKEMLENENIVPLNDDPNQGSYVLPFSRKKAPFEDHGRSVLQRCLRTIIYRDKLRQAQTTLASRNMTPTTLVVAPDVPAQELDALRIHFDEAKYDPDYTVCVNYECTVQMIGSEGRLLALDSEWAHTNAELAVGMGFTPEILTGEGFFSGDRIRVELLNTTYLQYRDVLADLVETRIFRPMAMRKGFYEIDDYGNPRWIYPKLSFSRLALRDQGDVYDMLFNLYAKGSLPVDIIYEFLNLDPETCKRKLEEDLLTVKDSKFNQVLDAIYAGVAEKLFGATDLVEKVSKSLQLQTKDVTEQTGPEGTGEGV